MRKKKAAKKVVARADTSSKARKTAKKKKSAKRVAAPKTRNAGTWSEGEFWQAIRSALRNRTRFWKPKLEALKRARRASQSENKRLKWEFCCSVCSQWHPQKNIQCHHEIEAGKLNSAEDLPGFVERLFSEDGWIVVCKSCHQKLHKKN